MSVGFASIWSIAEIFTYPRFLVAKHFPAPIRKMMLCMECSSFWIAGFLSIFFFGFLPGWAIFPAQELAGRVFDFFFGGVSTYLTIRALSLTNIFIGKNN
jgi:hypothetical protein